MRYFILLLLCSASVSFPRPLKVVHSTSTKLVLKWSMSEWDTVSVKDIEGIQTALDFPFSNIEVTDQNNTSLPGYSFSFGVPRQNGFDIVFHPEDIGLTEIHDPLNQTAKLRAAEPVFKDEWISEPSYSRFREYQAASVIIRPFSPMSDDRIRVLKEATVTINFPSAAHNDISWTPDSDYERMIQKILVNFKTAQGWVDRSSLLKRGNASAQSNHPFKGNQKLYTFRIGDGNRGFNECTNRENGIIRITGEQIHEMFGDAVDVASVAVYASHKGELGLRSPAVDSIPTGVSEIPLMRFDVNENGIVEYEDYFLLYVSGASDWAYDQKEKSCYYKLNRYDDYRTYWITEKSEGEGLAMTGFSQPDNSVKEMKRFQNFIYYRKPELLSRRNLSGGIDWVWLRLHDDNTEKVLSISRPQGADANRPWQVKLNRGSVDRNSFLSATLGSKSLCHDCTENWLSVDTWNSTDLNLQYSGSDTTGHYEIKGIQVSYKNKIQLDTVQQTLTVFSDTLNDAVSYKLTKTDSELAYLLRVPLNESEISLIDTLRGVSQNEYVWTEQGGTGSRFYIASESAVRETEDFEKVDFQKNGDFSVRDLRKFQNSTDYLIVTHEEFLEAARKLATHKKKMGFLKPRIVSIQDIYNQFSGGNADPSALRNFLLYVYHYWDRGSDFSYITLMGSGHYDYKKLQTLEESYIPTAQIAGKSRKENFCSDDFFVMFDTVSFRNQRNSYYFIGRLPAKTSGEASVMVEKIIETEDPSVADYGPWRNRFVLAADDDMQGNSHDKILNHHAQSENIWKRVEAKRPSLDVRKVYLFEYSWDEQKTKPGATRALLNEINQGTVAVNWIGHGSPKQWADEYLLGMDHLNGIQNSRKYPLFTSFSCSVGKFDMPDQECLSEILAKTKGAGAIASIASTRESSASMNERLAANFYELLFAPLSDYCIGSAFMQAKTVYPVSNNHLYALLGDPSIRLTHTNRQVNVKIAESGHTLDTLNALQKVTIEGEVKVEHGQLDERFSGSDASVRVSLFAPPAITKRKDGGTYTDPSYALPGNLIFSSDIEVLNGSFEQEIVLPMNVPFNKSGIKLTAYAHCDSFVGAGVKKDLVFGGSVSLDSLSDTTGPQISIRPVYNSETMDNGGLFVTSRLSSQLPLQCEIRVFDESGINVTGSGPDEGVTMEVKGALSKRRIDNYQFVNGDYRHLLALLSFDEGEIRPGIHEMTLTAQDLIGNISKKAVTFEILEREDLRLDHVINVPNPMRMGKGTRFYYYPSSSLEYSLSSFSEPEICIRIYSLGGRLLKVIRNPRNGQHWDGRDQRGSLLSPNVYLYQITASYPEQKTRIVRSDIKKLVVHPPR